MRNIFMAVDGSPGSGKTHFSLSAPKPLCVFDFDGGVCDALDNYPTLKHKTVERGCVGEWDGEDILIVNSKLPIQWSHRKRTYGRAEYASLRTDYDLALMLFETVLLDTGTTVYNVVREAYSDEIGKELMPFMYGEVNARINGLIQSARAAGKCLIMTQHVRPVYIDDKRTGEFESDGCKEVGNVADIKLYLDIEIDKKGLSMPRTSFYVAKSRLARGLLGQTYYDLDYAMLADIVDAMKGVRS